MVLGESDVDFVTNDLSQQHADAERRIAATGLSVAGAGHAQEQLVIHFLFGQALAQQAIRTEHGQRLTRLYLL